MTIPSLLDMILLNLPCWVLFIWVFKKMRSPPPLYWCWKESGYNVSDCNKMVKAAVSGQPSHLRMQTHGNPHYFPREVNHKCRSKECKIWCIWQRWSTRASFSHYVLLLNHAMNCINCRKHISVGDRWTPLHLPLHCDSVIRSPRTRVL